MRKNASSPIERALARRAALEADRELAHAVDVDGEAAPERRRPVQVQAGLEVGRDHAAEALHHAALARPDDEHCAARDEERERRG